METLVAWLVGQSPVIVVMGVFLYTQWKEIQQLRKERNELSKDALSIAIKYEHKIESTLEGYKALERVLQEIKKNTDGINK